MNVILEFGDDETKEAETALNGWKWKLAMYDLDQILRSTVKHNVSILNKNQQATSEEMNIADNIRDALREILEQYNLNLND
jgi:hypothetical protein